MDAAETVRIVISSPELSATPAAPSAPHSGIAMQLQITFCTNTIPAARASSPGTSRAISSVEENDCRP